MSFEILIFLPDERNILMIEIDRILEGSHQFKPADLPIGFYVSAKDGRIIECNQKFREILEIPPEDARVFSILDFFQNEADRIKAINRLSELENNGKWLEKWVIPFKTIKGRDIFVEDYCRSIRDSQTKAVIGFCGCLVDVTEEEHNKYLINLLPAGIYRLNETDTIVQVNRAFVKILGYENENELIGKNIRFFYANPNEEEAFEKLLIENGSVTNYKVELYEKNGATIFVSVNAFKIISPENRYAGREGTITDVTTEEQYRHILGDVPVGFYVLNTIGNKDIIRHCNKQFERLFGFSENESAVGFNIRQLTELKGEPQHFQNFINKLSEMDKQKLPLLGYPLKVKTRKGNDIVIEVNTKYLHDRENNIIGRIGVLRDMTKEAKLNELVQEFTDDIGSFLHAYSSTLVMLKNSINSIADSIGPNPFSGSDGIDIDNAIDGLKEQAMKLIKSFNRFYEVLSTDEYKNFLPIGLLDEMKILLDYFKNYEKNVQYPALYKSVFRGIALKILKLENNLAGYKIPRDIQNYLENDAEELIRICNQITLRQANIAIMEIDGLAKSLRDYITSHIRIEEKPAVYQIGYLIRRAVDNIEEFANYKNVDIKFKIEDRNIKIEVVERDVVRAIVNLLHNAIKYSWRRKDSKAPWITIRSNIIDSQIVIQIENWGVPIPREEIEQELIFQIGHRGRMSSDGRRMGTGIGLYDARKVAQRFGGTVTIDSRPASPGGRADDYSQPFITTAQFTLPIYLKG